MTSLVLCSLHFREDSVLSVCLCICVRLSVMQSSGGAGVVLLGLLLLLLVLPELVLDGGGSFLHGQGEAEGRRCTPVAAGGVFPVARQETGHSQSGNSNSQRCIGEEVRIYCV